MDDVEAVAEVLAAEDLAATGAVFYDADFVRLVWSGVLDMANDTWAVVAPDGRVIGHANVGRESADVAEAWGVVHPNHRGLGIGSLLIDLVDDRASTLLAVGGRLQQSVSDTDPVAAEMLRARGFERVRSFRHMEIDLSDAPPSPEPPAGIEIGPIDPQRDLPRVHSLVDRRSAASGGTPRSRSSDGAHTTPRTATTTPASGCSRPRTASPSAHSRRWCRASEVGYSSSPSGRRGAAVASGPPCFADRSRRSPSAASRA